MYKNDFPTSKLEAIPTHIYVYKIYFRELLQPATHEVRWQWERQIPL